MDFLSFLDLVVPELAFLADLVLLEIHESHVKAMGLARGPKARSGVYIVSVVPCFPFRKCLW